MCATALNFTTTRSRPSCWNTLFPSSSAAIYVTWHAQSPRTCLRGRQQTAVVSSCKIAAHFSRMRDQVLHFFSFSFYFSFLFLLICFCYFCWLSSRCSLYPRLPCSPASLVCVIFDATRWSVVHAPFVLFDIVVSPSLLFPYPAV